jgi:glycosyltransferase involved in cell wall biosynthesis
VRTLRPAAPSAWLDGVVAVAQPALVEHEPRRLLQALASGVPVVATPACGLDGFEGLALVEPGDAEALVRTLELVISEYA